MPAPIQNNLPGVSVADHSNLGADWENQLETTHEWYARQRIADVRKVPHSWALIPENEYRKLQLKLPKSMLAQTDDGKFMQRMKSDVDFTGGGHLGGTSRGGAIVGGRRFSICFDAKQTKDNKFPLGNIEEHQILRLKTRSRCGWVSGALVLFTQFDRAFFISADYLDIRYTRMLARKRGRRALPGTASISFADIEQLTIEITRNKSNGLWDWLPIVPVFL
jgi:penicillin-binding protein-related factor A (putative recombinase)